MLTTRLSAAPLQSKLTNEQGFLNQPWVTYFQFLYSRVGGIVAPPNTQIGLFGPPVLCSFSELTDEGEQSFVVPGSIGPKGPSGTAGVSGPPGFAGVDGEDGEFYTVPGPVGPVGPAGSVTRSTGLPLAISLTTTPPPYNAALNGAALNSGASTITASSPYTYIAPISGTLIVSGGGLSNVQFSRDGITFFPTGSFRGMFPLSAGDNLRVTYIAPPTLVFIPF